jgi:[acyl-carrier-protein] S-malonyltransferase
MQPAADRLANDLAALEIRKPHYPVIANVTGQPVDEPEEIRRLLARQVTSPVRWLDSMKWLLAQGVRECYEIGPGRVLQGLLKRTDPSCACATVSDAADVQAWAEKAADV